MLVLAAHFHRHSHEDMYKPSQLIFPACLIVFPALLILKQPDLGTTLLIMMIGLTIFFVGQVFTCTTLLGWVF
ncbi:MAG: FtsW/RodA/SpoVE family cell cycle protein [Holosporaceae bacterium]|nr:MAG: FtsW/RodA/SpoVE family cell cycle protein [Holosporaceae bacterium]